MSVLASYDVGFYVIAGVTVLLLCSLLNMYVQDEMWRRDTHPENKYYMIFSYQSIILKVGLLILTFLILLDQVTEPSTQNSVVHDMQIFCILLITFYRLYGRVVIRRQARREILMAGGTET